MYILKLWNQKWGKEARFVAFNPQIKKYTEFSPANPKDVAWVSQNLVQSPDYKGWQSCEDEPIQELENASI